MNTIHAFNVLLSIGVFVYAFILILCLIFWKDAITHIRKYGVWIVFTLSFVAMICSLIYSNVVGFPPCDLCWYQRIFFYPVVFMTGLALIRKETLSSIRPYLMLLTVVGGIISLYHNFIYYTGYSPLPCSATASCTARYVFEFGFVTIPLMALMSFTLVFVVLVLSKRNTVHS